MCQYRLPILTCTVFLWLHEPSTFKLGSQSSPEGKARFIHRCFTYRLSLDKEIPNKIESLR